MNERIMEFKQQLENEQSQLQIEIQDMKERLAEMMKTFEENKEALAQLGEVDG